MTGQNRITEDQMDLLLARWAAKEYAIYKVCYDWASDGSTPIGAKQSRYSIVNGKVPTFGFDEEEYPRVKHEARVLQDLGVRSTASNLLFRFSSFGQRLAFAERMPRLTGILEERVLKHPLLSFPKEGFIGYTNLFAWQDELNRAVMTKDFKPDEAYNAQKQAFDSAMAVHTFRIFHGILTHMTGKEKPDIEDKKYLPFTYELLGAAITNSRSISSPILNLLKPEVPRYPDIVSFRS